MYGSVVVCNPPVLIIYFPSRTRKNQWVKKQNKSIHRKTPNARIPFRWLPCPSRLGFVIRFGFFFFLLFFLLSVFDLDFFVSVVGVDGWRCFCDRCCDYCWVFGIAASWLIFSPPPCLPVFDPCPGTSLSVFTPSKEGQVQQQVPVRKDELCGGSLRFDRGRLSLLPLDMQHLVRVITEVHLVPVLLSIGLGFGVASVTRGAIACVVSVLALFASTPLDKTMPLEENSELVFTSLARQEVS